MERVNLNQLALITGLTTRTLRNYLNQGVLKGEKIGGSWSFTEEAVEAFVTTPDVRRVLETKQNALVYDFMADNYKKGNRICMMMDFAVEREEAAEIANFFCHTITEIGEDVQFYCMDGRHGTRVILSGAEDMVMDIVQRYYASHSR